MKSVGCHWGTWALTAEPVLEPPKKLADEARAAGLGPDDFITVPLGDVTLFAELPADVSATQLEQTRR